MRRVDVPGLVLLVIGVAALQFVLDRGQREDWFASSLIVWLSVVAAVALVALVVRELRVEEPVVDLRVLRHPTFAVATAAMFVISIAFYGIMVLSPLFTQILMGYTAMLAGLVLAPGGRGHAGHDADRRRPDEPHRSALDHRDGLRAERLRDVPDGHAHAGGQLLAHHAAALHPGARHRLHLRAALDGGAQRRPAARAGPRLRALQLHPDDRRQHRHRRGRDHAAARRADAPGAAGRPT